MGKLFYQGLLAADDARQCAQRVVHGFGVGKKLGHVRLQHHHVRAALVAPEMFAAHAGGKIIFRLHLFIGRFSGWLLHIVFFRGGWRAAR